MSDAAENYEKLRALGVPDEYLNDRHNVVRIPDEAREMIWVHEVDTNEIVWASPTTIESLDHEPRER
jgi:hypothetical protein